MVKFIGVPRSLVADAVGEMAGWRHLGERMLERVRAVCPVGAEEEGWVGPHLKDALEVRYITGTDPRMLIGTSNPAKGEVLLYLTQGTSDHMVAPVNARALRWTQGGTVFFSAGHEVKGIDANPFVMTAIREVAQGG